MVRIAALALLIGLAGCNPAEVTPATVAYSGTRLPYPTRVLVFNFAVQPSEVQLDQGVRARLTRLATDTSPSKQQAQAAQQANAALVKAIVTQLHAYGLPAEAVQGVGPPPRDRTLIVQGQFVSIDQGNRTRRTLVGLGAGQSSQSVDMQLYYYRADGKPAQFLQSFDADSDSGRAPGAAETLGVGAAAGTLAVAGGTTAATHAVSERRSASDSDLATKIGKGLAVKVGDFAVREGWIAPSAVK